MPATPATTWPRLRSLGDAALTVQFGDHIDLEIHARVIGFADALDARRRANALPGVIEWAAAFASVTVYFDPADAALESAEQTLLALARDIAPRAHEGRAWRIPVCFEGEFAPDLEPLAAARGLTPERVVELMTGTAFRVYMLGFLPGFPYLGGLPEACELPRRATPRQSVPARSLAVAGRMCAVYPWESPGGWHLLGRTPLSLFDLAEADQPALFAPGDVVHWHAIDAARYRELERRSALGDLRRAEFLASEMTQ